MLLCRCKFCGDMPVFVKHNLSANYAGHVSVSLKCETCGCETGIMSSYEAAAAAWRECHNESEVK